MSEYSISPEQLEKILAVLSQGHRVELIPAKDGVKIIQEVRKEVK